MFGTNPLRKVEHTDAHHLRVQEIFRTVQGEGPFAGVPAVFVRLAGCHLRCHFCDTDFESNYADGLLPVPQVVQEVRVKADHTASLVVLTGGEPLRQATSTLVLQLTYKRYHVQFETAGNLWDMALEEVPWTSDPILHSGKASLVVSPKVSKVHDRVAELAIAWKYIISSEDERSLLDGLPCSSTQHKGSVGQIARPPHWVTKEQIWLQPMWVDDVAKRLANLDLCLKLSSQFGYRMGLQQHRIFNLP